MRLKLTIAYHGGPFRGWQSQAGGGTIQDLLATAAAAVAGQPVAVVGAGRTDAGVHALAQCAHADVPDRLPSAAWLRAINAHLPAAIRVHRCTRVPPGFHARYSARGKVYRYHIRNEPVLSPFAAGLAWHVPGPIDLALLEAAAARFVGTRDFASFAANRGHPEPSTIRTIRLAAARRRGPELTVTYEGDGFLYKMVRLLTGAAVRCATGKADLGWLDDLLAGRDRCRFAAPAAGLYLVKVRY